MKEKWNMRLAFCLATTLYGLFGVHGGAQALNLNPSLNENVVNIPADANVSRLPSVTVPHTISSGATPATVSNGALIPNASNNSPVMLETTIFKPPGSGPFPILILNHGKSLGNPHLQERARFLVISKEFVKRGYAVVIPMRTGFGKSTGDYVEEECNMTSNGNIQAHDLQSILKYTLQQSWADKNRIIVAGQSYGGLTAMAFGAQNFPGVKGLINFAGGLKTSGNDCNWQASLIDAFSDYGSKTRVPSVWFYGANDSYFNPTLAAQLHDAYQNAGGHAKLVAFGPFKKDAHGMSSSRDGINIWWPEVAAFLQSVDMPTKEIFSLAPEIKLQKTNFAALDNVNAVPYITKTGRNEYRSFLNKSLPRAFAISETGAWSWAEDGDDPTQNALSNCSKISRTPCKIYAVDNDIVWSGASDQKAESRQPPDEG